MCVHAVGIALGFLLVCVYSLMFVLLFSWFCFCVCASLFVRLFEPNDVGFVTVVVLLCVWCVCLCVIVVFVFRVCVCALVVNIV